MAVWVVRAGRFGERETTALDNNIVVIGWNELPSLDTIASRDDLDALCRATYSEARPKTVTNWVAQLWAFRDRIQMGDLVVLPLKTRSAVAIGRTTGHYQYRPDLPEDARHSRPVTWETEIPRPAFDQDILYSFGAFLTVFQVQRNRAEQRIEAMLDGDTASVAPPPMPTDGIEGPADTAALINIEEYAADQIRAHIGREFREHELARLVDEVLKAQGYRTLRSPAGPDGGVDVIAGSGPIGFDAPRLCVQVKSGAQPADVGVLRELQGVLRNFGAQQGLLVSWGGIRQSVLAESRRLFFEIRLWDAGDLVGALLEHYDRLPPDLQAELPLKRIWTLVPQGEDDAPAR